VIEDSLWWQLKEFYVPRGRDVGQGCPQKSPCCTSLWCVHLWQEVEGQNRQASRVVSPEWQELALSVSRLR